MASFNIGILTRPKRQNRFPGYFKHFVEEGEKLGATVYVLTPATGRPEGGQCVGYVPSEGAEWRAKTFPSPDCIINRFGRFRQSTSSLEQYRKFLTQTHLIFANSIVNSKYHLYQTLREFPHLARWLPETALFSPETCNDFIHRYDLLYAKPLNGTGGRGIYRIERVKKRRCRLVGQDDSRNNPVDELHSPDSLIARLNELLKDSSYLIQQGMDLHLVPHRNSDLRLLLQKVKDQWLLTGHAMRIGEPNSPISNLHGGGTGVRSAPFLEKRFGRKQSKKILEECIELAAEVSKTMEYSYGPFIELGFDIGIDTSGKVRLIEVNTMPERNILRTTSQLEAYRLSYSRPIEHAIYLAQSKSSHTY